MKRQLCSNHFLFPMLEDPCEHLSMCLLKIALYRAETNTLVEGEIPLSTLNKVLCNLQNPV